MAIVGRVSGTEHFRNVLRYQVIPSERVLTVRVDESLYLANTPYLEDRIYDLVVARARAGPSTSSTRARSRGLEAIG